ncbi:MAG: DUF2911 domain-containing protein [Candidatus Latescibacteria bacterium]|jgi:hypothetical protein|nr:DUF2911 domain-containing protein [Candidatus Latescibacterota bacterium]
MRRSSRFFRSAALALTILIAGAGAAEAQSSRPAGMGKTSNNSENADRGMVKVAFGDKSVSIDYGRPQLKGRDMLAMAPDGFIWRFGSNTSTTIESSADVMFGTKKLAMGKYSTWLKHITGDQWALVFNSETGMWGDPGAKRENDILEIPLSYTKGGKEVERFTVDIMDHGNKNGHMLITWGTHRLETSFKTN